MVLAVMLFAWTQSVSPACAATLEAAKDCDAARDRLIELTKNPDKKEGAQVMDSLGIDVLNSCSVPKGEILCFQCVDKNGELRSLQLFHHADVKKFEFLGFGCRCKE